jgi:hypothetical protein
MFRWQKKAANFLTRLTGISFQSWSVLYGPGHLVNSKVEVLLNDNEK